MSRSQKYGAPCINPEKIQQSWKDYTSRALEPMVEWIQTAKPQRGDIFQYGEVHGKLREYEPPIRYGITFARKTLLPELFKRKVETVPLDLIAILYTLNQPCRECRFLGARLDVDQTTGLGSENLFLQFKYEDTGKVWSYLIRNFRQPEIAKLEVVGE
jgi:hypothetical protein